MAAALLRTAKHASLVPHSPPSRLSSAKDVCGRRAASRRTAPIPTTDCLPSSPQGGATGPSVPGPAGSGTASSLQLSPCCTLHHGDSSPLATPSHSLLDSPLYPGLTATDLPPATEHLH